MSILPIEYEPNIDAAKAYLIHWFKFDHLRPEQGIALLIGVVPVDENIAALVEFGKNYSSDRKTLESGVPLINGNNIGGSPLPEDNPICGHTSLSQDELEDALTRLQFYASKYDDLFKIWKSGSHPDCTPPLYFLKWALAKKTKIDWLGWAIELGLYSQNQEAFKAAKDQPLPYTTPLMEIQKAAIAEFFYPPHSYDAKQEDFVAWVIQKGVDTNTSVSKNIAEAMFTIIKPLNHSTKNKKG